VGRAQLRPDLQTDGGARARGARAPAAAWRRVRARRRLRLGPHVQRLPEDLREPFMDDVLAVLAEPVVVDYVRLNIDAIA